MNRYELTGARIELQARDLRDACELVDAVDLALRDRGVRIHFEAITPLHADVVPLARDGAGQAEGGREG